MDNGELEKRCNLAAEIFRIEKRCNLAAEIFRIEKSDSLKATIPPLVSFLNWTAKAGAQQDSLKRAGIVWFMRAQRGVRLFDDIEAIEDMDQGRSKWDWKSAS